MRIKSTTSTAKITKAMKMVAAAKLKGAERMMLAARPFTASIKSLMDPVLAAKEDEDAPESSLLLAVSSDKGLCGGINSRVVKAVKNLIGAEGATPEMIIVGGKARDGLARTHASYFSTTIDETYTMPVSFSMASFIAEQMLARPVDSCVPSPLARNTWPLAPASPCDHAPRGLAPSPAVAHISPPLGCVCVRRSRLLPPPPLPAPVHLTRFCSPPLPPQMHPGTPFCTTNSSRSLPLTSHP